MTQSLHHGVHNNQMSMSKPGPEHGDRHFPRPAGPQTAQKQHAGLLELDAQPSAASIRLPEGAAHERIQPGPPVSGSENEAAGYGLLLQPFVCRCGIQVAGADGAGDHVGAENSVSLPDLDVRILAAHDEEAQWLAWRCGGGRHGW